MKEKMCISVYILQQFLLMNSILTLVNTHMHYFGPQVTKLREQESAQAAAAASQLAAATEAWAVERSTLNAALSQAKSEAADAITAAAAAAEAAAVPAAVLSAEPASPGGALEMKGEPLDGLGPDAAADLVWANLRLFAQNYGKLQTQAYFNAYAQSISSRSDGSGDATTTLDNKAFKRALVAAGFTGISNKVVTQIMKTAATSAAAIAEAQSSNESEAFYRSTNKALNTYDFANVLLAGTISTSKESGEDNSATTAAAVAEALALQGKRYTDDQSLAQARVDDLEKSLASAKEEEHALQESLRAELATAQARTDEMEKSLATAKEESETLQESLHADLATAQAKADELEKVLATAKEEEHAKQESLRAELTAAQVRADDIEKNMTTVNEETQSRLQSELIASQQRADDMEIQLLTAKEEEQALQESLIALKASNDQAQTKVLQLQEDLTASQAAASTAAAEAAVAAAEEAKVNEAKMNGKLEEALAAEKEAKKQCAALTAEVSTLSSSLKLAQEKVRLKISRTTSA